MSELTNAIDQVLVARKAITDSKLRSGDLPCPVCKAGRLYFAVHHNGHVHASCTTLSCVRWIE